MKTDLSYLKSMSGDNQELIYEMIGIFTEQVDEISSEMQRLLNEKEYESLGKLAHKAKSSVAIMGMDLLSGKLKELELLTRNCQHPERYQDYIDLFKSDCSEAVKELTSYKKLIAEQ